MTISYGKSRSGPHGFMNVGGESFYQETLRGLYNLFSANGDPTERVFTAILVPEPDNPHDSNAVAVMTEGGAKIGHLPRDVARINQKAIRTHGAPVRCEARLCGGRDDMPAIGVVLDFAPVRELKAGRKVSKAAPGSPGSKVVEQRSQPVPPLMPRPLSKTIDPVALLSVVTWGAAAVAAVALIYGLFVAWVL